MCDQPILQTRKTLQLDSSKHKESIYDIHDEWNRVYLWQAFLNFNFENLIATYFISLGTSTYLLASSANLGASAYSLGTSIFFLNFFHKINSRYIFIVTMDYVDKSDLDVFTMKLTLVISQ